MTLLQRCDKCDKEFEKLLQCGRCKNAYYCSQACQTEAWKKHKNICRRPGQEASAQAAQLAAPKPVKTNPVTKKTLEPASEELVEAAEQAKQFRQELLKETQLANVKMMTVMHESGDPSKFLPQVKTLKDEYIQTLLERLSQQDKSKEDDRYEEAIRLGTDLMQEVIMIILQRGVSRSSAVDQLDLANNHFNAAIVQQRPPADFALEDDAMDGFEPAVTKVKDKGFVSVEGLLDDEIAAVIEKDCVERFWSGRSDGAMHQATGCCTGHECWVPYPPRKGFSPEFDHALRILFGLPHEIMRHGYPKKLKVPTMAHLACFPPETLERLHVDNPAQAGSPGASRELTIVLFLMPAWNAEDGGAFRAYLDEDGRARAKPQAAGESADAQKSPLAVTSGYAGKANAETDPADDVTSKDFYPEAGQCLIFRSSELWHQVLPSKRMVFALTLFVQSED